MSHNLGIRETAVTILFILGAVAATIAWHTQQPVGFLFETSMEAPTQPWRFFLSAFPHVNFYHLVFNLYWLWHLGGPLEARLGHGRYLLILILIGIGANAAEFAFLAGGVGLSGIVYGIFGMRWVLARRHSPLAGGPMPPNTVVLFVVWFFVCILLTITGIMPIANIAHGVGTLLGAMIGLVLSMAPGARRPVLIGLGSAYALIGLCAVALRPWVNFSIEPSREWGYAGTVAIHDADNERALALLEQAVRFRKVDPRVWYSLGYVQQRMKRYHEALASYGRAAAMDEDVDFKNARDNLKRYLEDVATQAATAPEK